MEMMGGALGAAGSIAGAFIAADAQKYSANTNWAIALMNYYARERERTQARFEAQRVEMKQDLGIHTPTMDTSFVPGVGQVTTEKPQQAALRGRETAEQMQRLGVDAQIRRQQLEANQKQQIKERDYSSALFDEMRKRTTPTVDELKHLISNAANTSTNRAFDDTMKIASRNALRKDVNPGQVFGDIARQRAGELRGIEGSSLAQAMSMQPQLEDQESKMQANLYNLFATRASAMPDVSFAPQALGSGAGPSISNTGGELAVKAAMMEGGRLPFVPPNYGLANAVGATGASLQGLQRNMQGRTLFSEGFGGGLWDTMSADERNRGNTGAFTGGGIP